MRKKIFTPGHSLDLVISGEPYFDRMLRLINGAQRHIHVQVYYFAEDHTAREVAEALKKARQRGVAVFLTVDSYGSRYLSPAFLAELQESGIQVKFFSPLPEHFYAFRLGRRLHNKVTIADHTEALLGGINIADKYRGNAEEAPWLDFAIVVRGPVCYELARICERIYREKYFGKLKNPPVKAQQPSGGTLRTRLVLNDWFRRKNQIGLGYRAAFREARHSIIVVASYFLPSRSIRTALKNAARRGVQVTLLLPGKLDVPLAKNAIRYLYEEMVEDNIRIYEWHESILHGKLAVVDHQWVTLGSYNLNHLSQYSSIEMNLEVLDQGFAKQVEDCLSDVLERSVLIPTYELISNRGIPAQVFDWTSYTLARWSMFFLFFLIRREHRYKEKE